jgi:hypothetical protein
VIPVLRSIIVELVTKDFLSQIQVPAFPAPSKTAIFVNSMESVKYAEMVLHSLPIEPHVLVATLVTVYLAVLVKILVMVVPVDLV